MNPAEFTYELPEDRIAKHALPQRDQSRLLHYHSGHISHHRFFQLPELLPEGSHLVFNDTRVIPARLIFQKPTGARIEIFLLDPVLPSPVHEAAMSAKGECQWHVMIGNARKWKSEILEMHLPDMALKAQRVGDSEVKFSWGGDDTFSEVLTLAGKIPLPPYLGREATDEDVPRYQTVYSRHEGAVAAPTAGLHFTSEVLDTLTQKGFTTDYVTLHVSAGTFQPIKAADVREHPMHREQVVIHRSTVEALINAQQVIAVGTTSMRTLESLYWFGQALSQNPNAPFHIPKLAPYQSVPTVGTTESLNHVLNYMKNHDLETLVGTTEIFIFPGYQFRICKGLITNFHQPGSTLMLLVAALIGENWKTVYDAALQNDYRFLSYGDSSLLVP